MIRKGWPGERPRHARGERADSVQSLSGRRHQPQKALQPGADHIDESKRRDQTDRFGRVTGQVTAAQIVHELNAANCRHARTAMSSERSATSSALVDAGFMPTRTPSDLQESRLHVALSAMVEDPVEMQRTEPLVEPGGYSNAAKARRAGRPRFALDMPLHHCR